jgi:hypothetical protein
LGSIASCGVLLGKSGNIKKYIHLVNNIAHNKNVDAKVTDVFFKMFVKELCMLLMF